MIPNGGGIDQIFNIKLPIFLLGIKIAPDTNFYEFEVGRGRLAILGWELMI